MSSPGTPLLCTLVDIPGKNDVKAVPLVLVQDRATLPAVVVQSPPVKAGKRDAATVPVRFEALVPVAKYPKETPPVLVQDSATLPAVDVQSPPVKAGIDDELAENTPPELTDPMQIHEPDTFMQTGYGYPDVVLTPHCSWVHVGVV